MLKPSRKILRKEIKKDPFLETFETIENGIQENKKFVINVLIFFVAIIFIGSIYINNQILPWRLIAYILEHSIRTVYAITLEAHSQHSLEFNSNSV